MVKESFILKHHLLEVAKTAVKMTIEQDEEVAMAYINIQTKVVLPLSKTNKPSNTLN